jgi:hypothetical protein
MLFVGVAPRKHVGEGSDMHSETKIFNHVTDSTAIAMAMPPGGYGARHAA